MLSHVFHYLFTFALISASHWLKEILQLSLVGELAHNLRNHKMWKLNLIASHNLFVTWSPTLTGSADNKLNQYIYTYPQRTKLQHKKKTMDNEKPKRIRTAHIAFVQKTMEGATGILVKPITWKIHQGKNSWDWINLPWTKAWKLSKNWMKQFWKTLRRICNNAI